MLSSSRESKRTKQICEESFPTIREPVVEIVFVEFTRIQTHRTYSTDRPAKLSSSHTNPNAQNIFHGSSRQVVEFTRIQTHKKNWGSLELPI